MSASTRVGCGFLGSVLSSRTQVLQVSALLVSLVLRLIPLWCPIAESSCKVERLFFGIPYEPRTTCPEAANRPLVSHWPKWDHMAFLNQHLARRMDYPQPSAAFPRAGSGVTSLEPHRSCWEGGFRLCPGLFEERCWVGLL